MKHIFWLALKLRLRQEFWGDWFMKWHSKQVKKLVDSIGLDTKDIQFLPDNKTNQ